MSLLKERIFSFLTYGAADLIGRLFKLSFLPILCLVDSA